MPRFSVIVPTYNRANYVTEAIESILSQSFQDHEIIVVDDGSTDNTKDVLARYEGRIRYIYQANSGVSAARNAGIRHAQGEWLAFLDSDDIWLPDYLACQMEQINRNTAAVMCMTNFLRFKANGAVIDLFEYYSIDSPKGTKADTWIIERPLAFIIQKGMGHLPTTVFKRENFAKAGPFNETITFCEDFQAVLKMCLQGPLSICNRPLAHTIRRHESIDNLTSLWTSNHLYCRNVMSAIYEDILSQVHLTERERRVVSVMLSGNKKAVGNLHLRSGDIHLARCSYRAALSLDPSLNSLRRLVVSYLPFKMALAYTPPPNP